MRIAARFAGQLPWMVMLLPWCVAAAPSANSASQEALSRDDSAAILFSNHFSFAEDGQPILPVAIAEEQKTLRFSAAGGIRFHPSGPGGPVLDVKGGSTWTVTLEQGLPAVLGHRVVLDELPTREFAKIREAQAAWKAQGVETDLLELGAVFSFEGTLFDSRLTLICTRAVHATVDQARRQREEISGWSGKELRRQEVLLQRPSGMISLRSQDGSTVVSARNAMWFEPIKEEGLTVPDVEFGKGFRWHGRETRRYSGSFYVAVDRHAHLALVNVLPAERLLQGVVPAEIYATAHPEALKAQAIAARNELFSKIGHRHLADPFLLCANQHCQVYKGLDAERATTSKAVLDTRGKVLFNQHGKLADCRYHSTDGGHTENSEEAWPGVNAPELRGRFTTKSPGQDPYRPLQQEEVLQFIDQPPVSWESGSSRTRNTWRWTESFSAEKVNQQVQQTHGIRRLERIEVLRRGVSGRVNHIRLHGEGRSVEVQGELVIRKLFFGLKSSLFVVEPRLDPKGTPVEWVFRGGGFGHGVGMSQNGAVEMAAGGKTFVEILQYYYHKVTLGRIY